MYDKLKKQVITLTIYTSPENVEDRILTFLAATGVAAADNEMHLNVDASAEATECTVEEFNEFMKDAPGHAYTTKR